MGGLWDTVDSAMRQQHPTHFLLSPSDEHISTLLDIRGDVSKEVRHMVLDMMAQHPQVIPESYRPIFSTILVPMLELPFCLRKGKCA